MNVDQGAGGEPPAQTGAQRALPGLQHGGQQAQRVADKHQAKGEGLPGLQLLCPADGRLNHIRLGHVAELLQAVSGQRRRGKELAVGAACVQGARLAIGVRQWAERQQGVAKGPAQHGARVGGQLQRAFGAGREVQAGDG